MAKTIHANQEVKFDRPYIQPIYLIHVSTASETLYFSDRCLTYNGHNYESYIANLPDLVSEVEQLGGYLNINANIKFLNAPLRTYNSLLEFFDANPITRKTLEVYVLYIDTGETFGEDVSTRILKASIGELYDISRLSFSAELFSLLHAIDSKNPFTQINTTNWPNAAPTDIGKYENIIYGSLRDIPCHCVQTYAVSTLFIDMAASGDTYIYLSDVDYPIAFPSSGVVKIGSEKIQYSAKSSANKTLTIQTRGYGSTTAAIHKRGTPVWVVEAPTGTALNFKYLVSGHQMKAVSVVYAGRDKVRIEASNYTLTLNDGGKTTITFTERQLQKVLEIIASSTMNEGSHTHASSFTTTWVGTSATYTPHGAGWSYNGVVENMYDSSLDTKFGVYNNGTGGAYAIIQVNFPAWTGPTPAAVLACICHASSVNNADGAYIRFYKAGGTLIADLASTAKTTQKWNIGTTSPTSLYLYVNAGSPGHTESIDAYEIWLEISTDETGASPASGVNTTVTVAGSDPEVIAPAITCDGDGYNDADGTYTGVADTLIENPSDVRRHLLIAVLGLSSADIGTSFNTLRTTYVNRIAGGYKFATILSSLGSKPSEILKSMDEQSRSSLREDAGLFQLTFNDTADPTSSLTIDEDNLTSEPIFRQSGGTEIKNLIRAAYDYDWSGFSEGVHFGGYKKQVERSNAASITKYGTLAEDWQFPAITITAMAEDVADWILLQKKDVIPIVELICNYTARKLERNDFFLLTYAFWSGYKWRIVEIKEIPGTQEFSIRAIKFISS